MKKHGSAHYIKSNFFSLLTVAFGALALALDQFGFLQPDIVIRITLGILILLASSELIDSARRMDHLEDRVKKGFKETIESLGGVSVITFQRPEDGLGYLADRVLGASKSLDLASLSPPVERAHSGGSKWEKAIEDTLLKNEVPFRYVCVFNDSARVERVKQHLADTRITTFSVSYFHLAEYVVPMPNFLIIDDEEVVAIFPSVRGMLEHWISIRHAEIVDVFKRHFDRLWFDSKKVKNTDFTDGSFDEIVQQIESTN